METTVEIRRVSGGSLVIELPIRDGNSAISADLGTVTAGY